MKIFRVNLKTLKDKRNIKYGFLNFNYNTSMNRDGNIIRNRILYSSKKCRNKKFKKVDSIFFKYNK